ncbi:MAG: M48 family metalloprotease [Oscillatoriales cyanobacterium SM2_1_8]|nr:M48 family metalloprotease [Oscillatoriales cyanobacterium SM2_1_8]
MSNFPKGDRATNWGQPLQAVAGTGNLALASTVTMGLLAGMVLALVTAVLWILESSNPLLGFGIAVGITIAFNTLFFFLSPWLMDWSQGWLYQRRWVELNDIARRSPQTADVIRRVCAEKNLKHPRLGLIADGNPTAFTYGTFPNSARLVVSEGLFTYLDDEEAAAVYAHELGHIVNYDFVWMTVAATLVQILYLVYTLARRMGESGSDKKKDLAQNVALVAYLFYLAGTYLLLYLSRTREYFADRFAAQVTGDPNALSRALVKIAYGILEEGERIPAEAAPARGQTKTAEKPPQRSALLEGTRALGIYDGRTAAGTGTAYRVAASPLEVGRVFLWDLFNPWGWWMELNSTHPLTGKRIRALSTYAEQMGIAPEFDMGTVVAEGNRLDKQRLYGSFLVDVLIFQAPLVGSIVGAIAGSLSLGGGDVWMGALGLFSGLLVGNGVGTLGRAFVMYPNFGRATETSVMALMSDPYASPLRGQPATLTGEIIGRGDAGSIFGSDLKLREASGMIYLRYASRFGPLGNFLFGWQQAGKLVNLSVRTQGWFRRGIAPWMDLLELHTPEKRITSHPRFWALLSGILSIGLGLFLGVAIAAS